MKENSMMVTCVGPTYGAINGDDSRFYNTNYITQNNYNGYNYNNYNHFNSYNSNINNWDPYNIGQANCWYSWNYQANNVNYQGRHDVNQLDDINGTQSTNNQGINITAAVDNHSRKNHIPSFPVTHSSFENGSLHDVQYRIPYSNQNTFEHNSLPKSYNRGQFIQYADHIPINFHDNFSPNYAAPILYQTTNEIQNKYTGFQQGVHFHYINQVNINTNGSIDLQQHHPLIEQHENGIVHGVSPATNEVLESLISESSQNLNRSTRELTKNSTSILENNTEMKENAKIKLFNIMSPSNIKKLSNEQQALQLLTKRVMDESPGLLNENNEERPKVYFQSEVNPPAKNKHSRNSNSGSSQTALVKIKHTRRAGCMCEKCTIGIKAPVCKQPDKKFACIYPNCISAYVRKSHLTFHINKKHKLKLPYVCHVHNCGMVFSRRDELTRHMHTHSSEKNYTCHFCNRAYKRSDNLNHHINIKHLTL